MTILSPLHDHLSQVPPEDRQSQPVISLTQRYALAADSKIAEHAQSKDNNQGQKLQELMKNSIEGFALMAFKEYLFFPPEDEEIEKEELDGGW